MTETEINHHVETGLEVAEGIVDLHTGPNDFHETWARYLTQMRERVEEELARTSVLLEESRAQEAHYEPEYSH